MVSCSTKILMGHKIKTKELQYKISPARQYYSNKEGIIQGIKTTQYKTDIYLVEFLNHNRIWITQEEIKSCNY